MSRYFFDVTHKGNLTQDEEGHELYGLPAVCAEAIAILPDLAREIRTDDTHQIFAVTAKDATGKPVFRAKLSLDCTWLE